MFVISECRRIYAMNAVIAAGMPCWGTANKFGCFENVLRGPDDIWCSKLAILVSNYTPQQSVQLELSSVALSSSPVSEDELRQRKQYDHVVSLKSPNELLRSRKVLQTYQSNGQGPAGVTVINSNPVSVSNPINIINPNLNFNKNFDLGSLTGQGAMFPIG
ncbi:hypothetical protein CEUSTIGMA_g6848.t1 [Chlamydomonas eustigma]|uniref:Uncharacterized protein n=1 Tax=Chlamydomonas eustigma TaxID=1157962 RepID=A0A250X8M0_9CHLO|nr:hypothetical protein CEUSTIGMA_g6848.t1 [Chlamydomonas eustigma]|eukprot:GAX79407.1 hypothetical protein CEUSTIGMA_g6848.t1 [Chlamydomonas eustigma]